MRFFIFYTALGFAANLNSFIYANYHYTADNFLKYASKVANQITDDTAFTKLVSTLESLHNMPGKRNTVPKQLDQIYKIMQEMEPYFYGVALDKSGFAKMIKERKRLRETSTSTD